MCQIQVFVVFADLVQTTASVHDISFVSQDLSEIKLHLFKEWLRFLDKKVELHDPAVKLLEFSDIE